MSERWISNDEAVSLIRARIGGSLGRAINTLKLARESGEVREIDPTPSLLMADDGILDQLNLRGVRSILPGRPATTALPVASINEDDLTDWLTRHYGPVVSSEKPMRSASAPELRKAMLAVASDPNNDRPNVKQLAKLVVARLRLDGVIVSENQIVTLADAPEFRALRRPPGKTKRSGG